MSQKEGTSQQHHLIKGKAQNHRNSDMKPCKSEVHIAFHSNQDYYQHCTIRSPGVLSSQVLKILQEWGLWVSCPSAAWSTYWSSFSDAQPKPSHTPSSVAPCYILHHYLQDLAISVNAFKAFLPNWKSLVPSTSPTQDANSSSCSLQQTSINTFPVSQHPCNTKVLCVASQSDGDE